MRWAVGALLLPLGACYSYIVTFFSFYIPHLCIGFVALGFYLGAIELQSFWQKWTYLAAGIALAFVSGLGGSRQPMTTYAPLLLVVGGMWVAETLRAEKIADLKPLGTAFLTFCASGIGYLVNSKVLQNIYSFQVAFGNSVPIVKPSVVIDYLVTESLESWGLQGMDSIKLDSAIPYLIQLTFCFLMIAGIIYCLRIRSKLEWGQKTFVLITVASIVLSSFILSAANIGLVRHLVPTTVLAVPVFAIACKHLGETHTRLPVERVATLAFVLVAVMVTAGTWKSVRDDNRTIANSPKAAAEWMVNQGLTDGVASFWNGNRYTELTDGKVDMWVYGSFDNPISAEAPFYQWLQRKSHLEGTPEGRTFLLMSDAEANATGAKKRLDKPDFDSGDGTIKIWLFDSFDDLHKALVG